MNAELWARGTAELGEGPRWLKPRASERHRLRWCDLLSGTVLERGEDGEARFVERFPRETLGAQIPLRGGGIAFALRRSVLTRDGTGRERLHLQPALPLGLRFSDGTAGPSGHLWIGTVPDGEATGPGSLLRIGADGVSEMRSGLGFANGIGFTADGRHLLHIDSDAGALVSIQHDPRSGELGEARTLYRLPEGPGKLDGLAVDDRDRIWVAVFGAGAVLCIDPQGRPVDRVTVPVRRVSSCCFGADALYITTARVGASARELQRQPLAGSVFRCDVGCAGGPVWEGDPLS